jgi:hypothetical protein
MKDNHKTMFAKEEKTNIQVNKKTWPFTDVEQALLAQESGVQIHLGNRTRLITTKIKNGFMIPSVSMLVVDERVESKPWQI